MWCTTFREDGGGEVEIGLLRFCFEGWNGELARVYLRGEYLSGNIHGRQVSLSHGQRVRLTLPSGDEVLLFIKRIGGHTRLFVGAPLSVSLRRTI